MGDYVLPIYEQLKYWLPLASGFVLAYKGFKSIKKSIDGWASTLFTNHLTHIQDATAATVSETQKTNKLLEAAATLDVEVAKQVAVVKSDLAVATTDVKNGFLLVRDDIKGHEDKEMTVWQGVVNTLAIIEDRQGRPLRRTSPKRRR